MYGLENPIVRNCMLELKSLSKLDGMETLVLLGTSTYFEIHLRVTGIEIIF